MVLTSPTQIVYCLRPLQLSVIVPTKTQDECFTRNSLRLSVKVSMPRRKIDSSPEIPLTYPSANSTVNPKQSTHSIYLQWVFRLTANNCSNIIFAAMQPNSSSNPKKKPFQITIRMQASAVKMSPVITFISMEKRRRDAELLSRNLHC